MTASVHAELSPTAAPSPLMQRWFEQLPTTCPPEGAIPERLLVLYFETDGTPTLDQVHTCMGCDDAAAGEWLVQLEMWLLPIAPYLAQFAAQDWTLTLPLERALYAQHVDEAASTLQTLDQKIGILLLTGGLRDADGDEAAARAIAAEVEALQAQQEKTERHQRRDLPAMAAQLAQHEADVAQRLRDAETGMQAARTAHVQQIEDRLWKDMAPLIAQLQAYFDDRGTLLDQVLEAFGCDLTTCGSSRLRTRLFQQLRGPMRPAGLLVSQERLREELRLVRARQDEELRIVREGQAEDDLRPMILDRGGR